MALRKISAKAVIMDIKAGLSDAALRQKYQLSEKELQTVFKKVVETGVLRQEELDGRQLASGQSAQAASGTGVAKMREQELGESAGQVLTGREPRVAEGPLSVEIEGTDEVQPSEPHGTFETPEPDVERKPAQGRHLVSRIRLYLLILAIPLLSLTVGLAIQNKLNTGLREAAASRGIAPEIANNLSLGHVCKSSDPRLSEVCSLYGRTQLMNGAAIAAVMLGLAVIAAITLAGRLARRRRMILLVLFRPGLYATVLAVAGLMVLHAGLVIAAIYYGGSVFSGKIFPVLMIAIGFGALVGIARMLPAAFSIVRRMELRVLGKPITRRQAPSLWKEISGIAEKLNVIPPRHIVVGLDANFFVTESDVICVDGELTGRTLYCSLPFCRILTASEFLGIIGHELGHFKGLDTQFSQKFYPVYRGTISSIMALQETNTQAHRSITLLPALAVLSYFLESFAVAERNISRQRELAADRVGVTASSKSDFASALTKVHAFGNAWLSADELALEAIKRGQVFQNLSLVLAKFASSSGPDVLKDLDASHIAHPIDSHPPFGVRIRELGITLEEISQDAMQVEPKRAAITLIPGAEAIEEELSGIHHAFTEKMFRAYMDNQSGEAGESEKG